MYASAGLAVTRLTSLVGIVAHFHRGIGITSLLMLLRSLLTVASGFLLELLL
jgi:hypothetical protein